MLHVGPTAPEEGPRARLGNVAYLDEGGEHHSVVQGYRVNAGQVVRAARNLRGHVEFPLEAAFLRLHAADFGLELLHLSFRLPPAPKQGPLPALVVPTGAAARSFEMGSDDARSPAVMGEPPTRDVNDTDDLAWTALHEAAINSKDAAMCKYLLEHGAEHQLLPHHLVAPALHLALEHDALAKLLLEGAVRGPNCLAHAALPRGEDAQQRPAHPPRDTGAAGVVLGHLLEPADLLRALPHALLRIGKPLRQQPQVLRLLQR